MVERNSATLDGVFHSLSDPTRRAMLRELTRGPCSIGQLAAPHAMSFAAASKHVRVLEVAGLLQREVRGREHVCQLSALPLAAAHDYLAYYATFWASRLDALEALLLEETRPAAKPARRTQTSKARKVKPRHVR